MLVAQGTEAGGHGGRRGTLPFVPQVVDLAGAVPVLAAGGIADGRGLAAALTLGAAGALIGTRFQACPESLASAATVKALLAATGADTERTRVLDLARDSGWPERYTARVLRNRFLEQWRGREDELLADPAVRAGYQEAARREDPDVVSVWAGEAVDLVTAAEPAREVVESIAGEAERVLRDAARLIRPDVAGH